MKRNFQGHVVHHPRRSAKRRHVVLTVSRLIWGVWFYDTTLSPLKSLIISQRVLNSQMALTTIHFNLENKCSTEDF